MRRYPDDENASDGDPERASRREYLSAIAATGIAGFAGCTQGSPTASPTTEGGTPSPGSPNGSVWSTPCSGSTMTASSSCAEPLSSPPDRGDTPGEGGSPAWETSIQAGIRSIAGLNEDRLLVAGEDGTLAAMARETGDVEWEATLADAISDPVVGGTTVVIRGTDPIEGGRETTLYALDGDTGERLWSARTEGLGQSGAYRLVDVSESTVLIRNLTDEGPVRKSLETLSLADGSTRGTISSDAPPNAGPQTETFVEDGTVYCGGAFGVEAFAPDGSRRWRRTLGDPGRDSSARVTAAVCGHVIVSVANDTSAGSGADAVYGLDVETGECRWSSEDSNEWTYRDSGERLSHTHRGRLFVENPELVRLDPTTGDPVWMGEESAVHSLFADGLAVVSSGNVRPRGITARAISGGAIEWERGFDTEATPVGASNGRIAVMSGADGWSTLSAMDTATGDVVWSVEAERAFDRSHDPLIGPDRAYVIDQPEQEDAPGTVRAITV